MITHLIDNMVISTATDPCAIRHVTCDTKRLVALILDLDTYNGNSGNKYWRFSSANIQAL